VSTSVSDQRVRPLVLVTGATGYIGSQLIEPLSAAGYRVRVSARSPHRIPVGSRRHADEIVAADAFDEVAVAASLRDVHTAFYLVHTLGAGPDYARRDRRAAEIFSGAARAAGVRRVVFLGGLGEDVGPLSEHLASRQEVGRILASAGVDVVEFRASIVIGSGSTSFEMIRNLVEKLPVMTTPAWVRMGAQPVSIRDVVAYAVAAVALTETDVPGHRVFEIGGSEVVTYGDLLRLFAAHRGLRRLIIPVPLLSPRLSGWWLYLFTPREAVVGRQLAESLRHPTVVTDQAARVAFPDIRPIGAREAISQAFADEDAAFATTRWADELAGQASPAHLVREGRYVDSRVLHVECPPEAAFDPIACIGGERGWYAFDTLWDVRGFIDILVGGPGRRRGRRDQYALVEGDHLEWWRVEKVVAPTLLRLRAEMRMPGAGWLQYELRSDGDGTLVRQTAVFHPKGLPGRAYWYFVLPMHHFVFNGTLNGIRRECRELVEGPDSCPLPGRWERETAGRTEIS